MSHPRVFEAIQKNKRSPDKYIIPPFRFLGTRRDSTKALAALEQEVVYRHLVVIIYAARIKLSKGGMF